MSVYIATMFKCNVLACVKQSNCEHTAFECDFLCYIMVKMRNIVIMFDDLKVLIIVPKESKNDLVQAIFYKIHLKQLNVECTALDCDLHCYVMAMRGEILYHI